MHDVTIIFEPLGNLISFHNLISLPININNSKLLNVTILIVVLYFSASGAGQGSIDHRIEQAMVSKMIWTTQTG